VKIRLNYMVGTRAPKPWPFALNGEPHRHERTIPFDEYQHDPYVASRLSAISWREAKARTAR
jgi:hypothetical protein